MNRRRRFDKFIEPFIVTMPDGTRFRCSLGALGREAEPRWILLDTNGAQYVGPPVEANKSHEAVERLISSWWENAKASPG